MKTITTAVFTCFIFIQTFSQTKHKVSIYLNFDGNITVYDRTLSNNSAGIGFGLQTFYNTKTKFKPTLEITGDAFSFVE